MLNSKFVKKSGLPFLKLLHGLLDACEVVQLLVRGSPSRETMTTTLSVARWLESEMESCYETIDYNATHLITHITIYVT